MNCKLEISASLADEENNGSRISSITFCWPLAAVAGWIGGHRYNNCWCYGWCCCC
jgi:hypothetical protein